MCLLTAAILALVRNGDCAGETPPRHLICLTTDTNSSYGGVHRTTTEGIGSKSRTSRLLLNLEQGETHEMNKLILLLIILLTMTTITSPRLKAQSLRLPGSGSVSCKAMPMLPSVFYNKFDCSPCCVGADLTFGNCMHSGKGKCQCIQAAFDACLDGGCGPCTCCAGWIDTAQMQGCGGVE